RDVRQGRGLAFGARRTAARAGWGARGAPARNKRAAAWHAHAAMRQRRSPKVSSWIAGERHVAPEGRAKEEKRPRSSQKGSPGVAGLAPPGARRPGLTFWRAALVPPVCPACVGAPK